MVNENDDIIVDDSMSLKNELGDTFKNLGSNIKNALFPKKAKSGTMQQKKVRVTKYRDYDKKVTTYKIVTMVPKTRI